MALACPFTFHWEEPQLVAAAGSTPKSGGHVASPCAAAKCALYIQEAGEDGKIIGGACALRTMGMALWQNVQLMITQVQAEAQASAKASGEASVRPLRKE